MLFPPSLVAVGKTMFIGHNEGLSGDSVKNLKWQILCVCKCQRSITSKAVKLILTLCVIHISIKNRAEKIFWSQDRECSCQKKDVSIYREKTVCSNRYRGCFSFS